MLPTKIIKLKAPPIKCQGIKTKLVPFIAASVRWDGNGRWIEPFVGSGAVAFNIAPAAALLCDSNEHVIRLYASIQTGIVTPDSVRKHLQIEGALLCDRGEQHYYEVRDRFNDKGDSHDFLFLNRSCFNGLIRFNRAGRFNVPFCRKPDRFRPAYVTKICNQVAWLARQMHGRHWTFACQRWETTLSDALANDFVYLDPPYIGRHTDYYNQWSDESAADLALAVKQLPCGFAYSMWLQNRFRVNGHVAEHFDGYPVRTWDHFYHVGSQEELRHAMEEALVVAPGYVTEKAMSTGLLQSTQTTLSL